MVQRVCNRYASMSLSLISSVSLKWKHFKGFLEGAARSEEGRVQSLKKETSIVYEIFRKTYSPWRLGNCQSEFLTVGRSKGHTLGGTKGTTCGPSVKSTSLDEF